MKQIVILSFHRMQVNCMYMYVPITCSMIWVVDDDVVAVASSMGNKSTQPTTEFTTNHCHLIMCAWRSPVQSNVSFLTWVTPWKQSRYQENKTPDWACSPPHHSLSVLPVHQIWLYRNVSSCMAALLVLMRQLHLSTLSYLHFVLSISWAQSRYFCKSSCTPPVLRR